jgi:membrane protease subunit HflK
MNFNPRALGWSVLPQRLRGMFNLNDPRWGRGDDKSTQEGQGPVTPPGGPHSGAPSNGSAPSSNKPSQNAGPPDLDELWRDLNRKLSQFFFV